MTYYNKSSHTIFYHRFHIVWITKYRYRVLQGNLRVRIREIIARAAEELGIRIINGVLSADHVQHYPISYGLFVIRNKQLQENPETDMRLCVFGV